MAVGNLVKRLQDIMRKDAGINGDAQRIEQMVWMFFLKVYDAAEDDWELDAMDKGEKSILNSNNYWKTKDVITGNISHQTKEEKVIEYEGDYNILPSAS